MLTGKQKRHLRSIATGETAIFQVGKNGVNDTLLESVTNALEARELIKIKVLNNSLLEPNDVGVQLAEGTGSELVQVIGNNLVLFRRSTKKQLIELPKE